MTDANSAFAGSATLDPGAIIQSLCDRLHRINLICHGRIMHVNKVREIEALSGGFAKGKPDPDVLIAMWRQLGRQFDGEPLTEIADRGVATSKRKLTQRQSGVLEHLCTGKTNRAIGEALGISEKTVKSHVTAIFNRHGVSTRAELIVACNRDGARR